MTVLNDVDPTQETNASLEGSTNAPEGSSDVEQEARNLGWRPKEEFQGNPDQWVDADEFVERGKHIVPILKDNNKRLQKELHARDLKINKLESSILNNEAAIEKMEAHWLEANKRAVQQARQELKEELKRAREQEDTDAELDVLERIRENTATEKALNKPTPTADKKSPTVNQPSPEYVEFVRENPWFDVDKKRTKAVVRIAEDLREDGNTLEGKAFFDECVRQLLAQEGSGSSAIMSKVEGGNAGTPGGSARGKSWANLPKEAQVACLADADVLVGADKRYKTLDAWKKKYTDIYFSGE